MKHAKSFAARSLLTLLVAASATACSTTPKPPVVVEEAAIPKLSSELNKSPLPSGSYWSRVTEWRKVWGETLKTLPLKSGD